MAASTSAGGADELAVAYEDDIDREVQCLQEAIDQVQEAAVVLVENAAPD